MKRPIHFIGEVEEEIGEEVQRLTGNSTSIISGLVGNVMEWYDFALHGYVVSDQIPAYQLFRYL